MTGAGAPVLVLGGDGQLGTELRAALTGLGPVEALSRAALDLTDLDALRGAVCRLRPRVIVNAAAYTAVDRAESEPELAAAVNAAAPRVLAEEAVRVGAALVHFSTDYVFDGRGSRPYRETDPPAPCSVYGRTKLAGEEAVLATHPGGIVLRTGWVYAAHGSNFLLTIQRLAREGGPLRVVADQRGTPTSARFLARATATILSAVESDPRGPLSRGGLYHLACAGETTWCDFARAIVAHDAATRDVEVQAITTEEYPTPAHRPRYSVLDTSLARATFGIEPPTWEEALRLTLESPASP